MQKDAHYLFSFEVNTMLSLDAIREIRAAYDLQQPAQEKEIFERLGNPTQDVIIETALAGMQSEDRNVRVAMLRVLRWQTGEEAMQGILTGLSDPARRVREVAIHSSGNYHQFPEITNRLKEMVIDEGEKHKIRGQALSSLAGFSQKAMEDLTQTATDALQTLAKTEKYRFGILFRLLRLDLTDRVEELLKEFVKNGTKAEAIMATRALCGYRVVHIGVFENDKTAQRHIIQTCELAAGRMFYWITRAEYDALTGKRLAAES
jgi:hypothetical protein